MTQDLDSKELYSDQLYRYRTIRELIAVNLRVIEQCSIRTYSKNNILQLQL